MKAIIFDMDGVISDTEETYIEAFNKTMKDFGIKFDKDQWLRKRFPGSGTRYTLTTALKEHGIEPKEGLDYWLEQWKNNYEEKVNQGNIKPVEGFMEFNKKLNSMGVKKIIATGGHEKNTRIVLKMFRIDEEFDVVSIDDVKNGKPDPEMFLKAAERLNETPENCVVFEDSPLGIKAANDAGMVSVALTTTFPRDVMEEEKPDFIFQDYTEIDVEKLLR